MAHMRKGILWLNIDNGKLILNPILSQHLILQLLPPGLHFQGVFPSFMKNGIKNHQVSSGTTTKLKKEIEKQDHSCLL